MGSFNLDNLNEQFGALPGNLANHLMITVIALAAGLAISLPLAVLAAKRRRLRYPMLAGASIIQTIPSLALLALMVPLLAAVGYLTVRAFGVAVAALGFWPTIIALTLYSMLPILRNTVTGIVGVDPALTEAARGVGMKPRQVLFKVELPLAAPVIIAGVRTATVWVVGIATLATPVGQTCLGNYIFRGLQTRNWLMVLFGCVAAALLAIVLDLLIGGVERSAKERRRGLGAAALAALAVIFVGGIAAPSVVRALRPRSVAAVAAAEEQARGPAALGRPVRIGSKTFTEQYILAALIRDRLAEAGLDAREKGSLGSTIVFDALRTGQIDVYVDYSGTIWANYMKRSDPAAPWKALAEMDGWLASRYGIRDLGPLGFENAYAMAMRREQAERLGVRTLADLAPHTPRLKVGGDYEFFGRPEWRAIRDAYGLRFADQVSYDSTFMYEAAAKGYVDVISAFSSDGRIAAFDLVVLSDPKHALPPYDAVLLLSPQMADQTDVVRALRPLVGAISLAMMQQANNRVDRDEDKKTPDQAARWLAKQIAK